MSTTLRVRAVVPHFFFEGASNKGYGSERAGQKLARSCALVGCINSLVNLRRGQNNYVLDIPKAGAFEITMAMSSKDPPQTIVEINVFTTGDRYLSEALNLLGNRIVTHNVDLDNPRYLPHAARDYLINHPNPADLNLYLEDDLIIHDPWFAVKMLWMANNSNHQVVLLPHRYELTAAPGRYPRLYVDGPAMPEPGMDLWHQPHYSAAKGNFKGQNITFDIPPNPHAGCFGLSRKQLMSLKGQDLPREEFIGPLETAATMTVGKYFKILKTSFSHCSFFEIQHAHPSFLINLN